MGDGVMRLSLLLWGLYQWLWIASKTNKNFKKFIRKTKVRLLIKTEDGKYARLFVFDKGKVATKKGPNNPFDAAIVWKDPKIAFSVMLKKSREAFFYAAAEGKLKIEGMSVYALWFDDAMNHLM
jgi:hypothetical protein